MFAIAFLIAGLIILVLDLGRPDRLIVAMTTYNFKSIFAWNIFLYSGFFVILAALLGLLTVYGFYRMTQRGISDVDTSSYATVLPTTSVVAVEIAQELAIEAAEELDESA